MESVTAIAGPPLAQKLWQRRSETFDVDGTTIQLTELSALDAAAVWGELEGAEQSGRLVDAYTLIILHGALTAGGSPVFSDVAEVGAMPARLMVPMAETIMRLTELELDSGKADAPNEP